MEERKELLPEDLDCVEIAFTATCNFCGETYEESFIDMADFDEDEGRKKICECLRNAGWDTLSSEKYATEDMACPFCLKATE